MRSMRNAVLVGLLAVTAVCVTRAADPVAAKSTASPTATELMAIEAIEREQDAVNAKADAIAGDAAARLERIGFKLVRWDRKDKAWVVTPILPAAPTTVAACGTDVAVTGSASKP